MKYSMNYYPKKSMEVIESHNQEAEILESFRAREKKVITSQKPGNENNRFQFVVPWQLP